MSKGGRASSSLQEGVPPVRLAITRLDDLPRVYREGEVNGYACSRH